MPKYKITATDEAFGGRQQIRLQIYEGPTRIFSQKVGSGKEAYGEDNRSVELSLTPEQAQSVAQAGSGFEVEEIETKSKADKASKKDAEPDTLKPIDNKSKSTTTDKE